MASEALVGGIPFPNVTVTGWWHQPYISSTGSGNIQIRLCMGRAKVGPRFGPPFLPKKFSPETFGEKTNNPKIPGLQIPPKTSPNHFGMKCGLTVMEKKQGVDLKMFPVKP